jgi:hypothetical protein
MDDEVLGKGATTIVRDKSGKKRDLLAEAELEREKLAKEAEKKAKYKEWNKGFVLSVNLFVPYFNNPQIEANRISTERHRRCFT